jgi:tRNA (cmo5U34)-methyltransferase
MTQPALTAFDSDHAAAYDARFAKLQAFRDALHLVAAGVLLDCPQDARILCVGAGTGAEILALAERYPGWHFTAVEPSAAMLEVCQRKVAAAGIADRCVMHEGYLDSLPEVEPFDAAISFLVSQFVLEIDQRVEFFRRIADRLTDDGVLINADLSARLGSEEYDKLFALWAKLFAICGITQEQIEGLRSAYGRDVSVLPSEQVAAMIRSAGFEEPLEVLQTVMIRAWVARVVK